MSFEVFDKALFIGQRAERSQDSLAPYPHHQLLGIIRARATPDASIGLLSDEYEAGARGYLFTPDSTIGFSGEPVRKYQVHIGIVSSAGGDPVWLKIEIVGVTVPRSKILIARSAPSEH